MCKYVDLIDKASLYINEYVSVDASFVPMKKSLLDELPMSVSEDFELYEGSILDHHVVLACIDDAGFMAPLQLYKKISLLEQKLNALVILVAEKVVSYKVTRLTKYRINFIIPYKQLFLPSLLMSFRKETANELSEHITPITQMLILYHLEVDAIHGMDTHSLAERLRVSYSSMNRAVRWLYERGLITLTNEKVKLIEVSETKKDLWEKVLPLLENPIEEIVFTDSNLNASQAGINALSEYTMINREQHECYALTRAELNSLQVPTDKRFGNNVVQIWRYSPSLLSGTNTVDKLSLYLSLKDLDDERIQIELDNLIKEIPW
ncbi:hypothetical protein [Hoylesella loescheii]|uniref:hypothetical protein n=1 Tax=Hoylesella loescheii TaxID=840 RepID=UPI00248D6E7A|nr:hypothetical protein [Hoylesella loescheii]